VPLNLFRNSGAKFSATLEKQSFYKLESLNIKINLRITGGVANTNVTLTMPTYWFDRHEYRASNGSRHLNIVYADSLHFALTTLEPKDLARYVNAMGSTVVQGALGSVVIGTGPVVALNGSGEASLEVFIPIIGGWIDNGDIYWKNTDGDLVFDFHPRSDIRTELGATYNVDCSDMTFVVQTEDLNESDVLVQEKFHNSVASEIQFLDAIPINYFSETINAGQKKNFKLDTLNGEFSFLVCYIRNTAPTNANIHDTNIVNIGDTARIDIVKSSGQSILGDGSAIPYKYLKNYILTSHFPNQILDNMNVIVVPFGGSCSSAFNGYIDGCMHFDNSNVELSITPDSSFTSGVYDITCYGYKSRTLFSHFGRLSVSD
jgi:hypothetical protein